MKAIIAIGDSWTQGVGGVPEKFFQILGGRVDVPDTHDIYKEMIEHELANSWPQQLKSMMPDYEVYNLGIRGCGNRAAVKSLYTSDIDFDKVTEGYLIFLLSGRDRFDLISKSKSNSRRKFVTMFPNNNKSMYAWWLENVHSEHFSAQETLLSILEAQYFAKLHNLEFIFGYAFDNCNDLQSRDEYNLAKKINWEKCFTQKSDFLSMLSILNNTPSDYGYYFNLEHCTEYITNCVHPTIKGYKVIADTIKEFIDGNSKTDTERIQRERIEKLRKSDPFIYW